MSIITYNDFKGEQVIAGIETEVTRAKLQVFIDKYEPKFLKSLLGLTLYNEFIAGLILVPVEPTTDPVTYQPILEKWLYLRDQTDLKQMLVCYVYYWYKRNEVTHSLGTGEGKSKNENSNQASSVDKQVTAWNEMVEMVREFDLDVEVYPTWDRKWITTICFYDRSYLPDIYHYLNSLNI